MTLARQAAIDDMDIRANRFTFSQNFELESLTLMHKLKAGTVDGLELSMQEEKKELDKRHQLENQDLQSGPSNQCVDICEKEVDHASSNDNPESASVRFKRSELMCTSVQSYDIFKKQFCFMESIFTEDFIQTDPLKDIPNVLPSEYIEDSCKIINILNKFGFKGALECEIEEQMGKSIFTLWPLLRCLQKIHAIFSVGMTHRRYVSRCYSSDWLVKTDIGRIGTNEGGDLCFKDSNRKIRYFQARMWRTMSGDLNYPALSLVFHKLITFLIRQSGISLQALCLSLNPDLLPVATLDLVDVLRDIHCLEIKCFPNTPRRSLFSTRKMMPSTGDVLLFFF